MYLWILTPFLVQAQRAFSTDSAGGKEQMTEMNTAHFGTAGREQVDPQVQEMPRKGSQKPHHHHSPPQSCPPLTTTAATLAFEPSPPPGQAGSTFQFFLCIMNISKQGFPPSGPTHFGHSSVAEGLGRRGGETGVENFHLEQLWRAVCYVQK